MSDHTTLCARLRELSYAVTRGPEGRGEFTMRVPVEPERDADVVLSRAATLIEQQAARIAELEKTAVRFLWINPFNPVEGAAMPMIPESWRYAFVETDRGLTFGYHDNGPFVAWDAVKDQAARIAKLERGCRCVECLEPALHQPVCEPCVRLVLERHQERIAELEAALTWRPMSAAPTGTVVLCANSRGTFFTARHDGEGWFDQNQLERDPVAWMPIPPFEEPKP